MYNEELEKLIEFAFTDGQLTDKEKQVLIKKAVSYGIDADEFEMVLDARLYELQKLNSGKETASNLSEKKQENTITEENSDSSWGFFSTIVDSVSETASSAANSVTSTYDETIKSISDIDIKSNLKGLCEHIDFPVVISKLESVEISNPKAKNGIFALIQILKILGRYKEKDFSFEEADKEISFITESIDLKVAFQIVSPVLLLLPFGLLIVFILEFFIFND